ncbi:MAG: peptidase [Gammaproteobacteria bacterium SG8_47]|nr:MAG: peptidase [Gammaproteobacteria bacterium SG8_47]
MKPLVRRLVIVTSATLFSFLLLGMVAIFAAYVYLAPKLPSIDLLKDVQLQVPLRVYANSGELIAEFGEMKRTPLRYEQFPTQLVDAVLATEDDRFFEHPGVDYKGILRAALNLILTGERSQGGSTITMQVARNFFLSREKTYLRKLTEIFLALKIENELTKPEILELYFNKIYLGNRSYGFAAASQVYYGKDINELNLAQIAMLAGLPKAPSRYNPIADPERATIRRDYVLARMHELGMIDEPTYSAAVLIADDAMLRGLSAEVEAPYVAEMVRAELLSRYGEEAYSAGYEVVTTLDAQLQAAGNQALRDALLGYEMRHGYRGPEAQLDPLQHGDAADWDAALADRGDVGNLPAAVIIAVEEQSAYAYVRGGQVANLPWEGIEWARRYIDDNHRGPPVNDANEVLAVGDVVRVWRTPQGCWYLGQIPQVSGALVAMEPNDGAIRALVGGFDYFHSKFNRAVQAQRQPGSSFKPFIYSAALDKEFTAATIVNDAPVVFEDSGLEATWRPENYSGRFYGPTRLRQALVNSRNLVSIRVLRAIGIGYAVRYASRFGFDAQRLPRDLSLALGSGTVTPLELATGYSTFANGGFKITPYTITEIRGPDGTILFKENPARACADCEHVEAAGEAVVPAAVAQLDPVESDAGEASAGSTAAEEFVELAPRHAERVIDAQTAFIMTTMMRDVIRQGTGQAARRLGRNDLAGKTGTTNDQLDAWFSGFNSELVATAWVGFDTPRPLGSRETGGRAALPMWMSFMEAALRGRPETPLTQPEGLVVVRIDPDTGLLARSGDAAGVFEFFRPGREPTESADEAPVTGAAAQDDQTVIPEQLF